MTTTNIPTEMNLHTSPQLYTRPQPYSLSHSYFSLARSLPHSCSYTPFQHLVIIHSISRPTIYPPPLRSSCFPLRRRSPNHFLCSSLLIYSLNSSPDWHTNSSSMYRRNLSARFPSRSTPRQIQSTCPCYRYGAPGNLDPNPVGPPVQSE